MKKSTFADEARLFNRLAVGVLPPAEHSGHLAGQRLFLQSDTAPLWCPLCFVSQPPRPPTHSTEKASGKRRLVLYCLAWECTVQDQVSGGGGVGAPGGKLPTGEPRKESRLTVDEATHTELPSMSHPQQFDQHRRNMYTPRNMREICPWKNHDLPLRQTSLPHQSAQKPLGMVPLRTYPSN